jgi:hypothetical protein
VIKAFDAERKKYGELSRLSITQIPDWIWTFQVGIIEL